MARALAAIGWILFFAVIYFAQHLQRSNDLLHQELGNSQKQLHASNQRIVEMEAELSHFKTNSAATRPSETKVTVVKPLPTAANTASPPKAVAKELASKSEEAFTKAQERVRDLEKRLARLKEEDQIVNENSHAYKAGIDAQSDRTKAQLEGQIQELNRQVHDLNWRRTETARQRKSAERETNLLELDRQRGLLLQERTAAENQLRVTGAKQKSADTAIHSEVSREKQEIVQERGSLERDLAAAKAELARLRSSSR